MRYTALACAILLASCSTTKRLPVYTVAEKEAQRQDIGFWQPEPAPADSSGHTKPAVAVQLPPIAAPDSLPFIEVTRKATIFDKLLKRTPKPTIYLPGSIPAKVGKKSTVNIYNAPATVTNTTVGKKATAATAEGATATVIEKKAGPAVVASDSSTLNAVAGGGNLAAVQGDNNKLEQKADLPQFSGWHALLTGPVGYALGAVVLAAAGYGVYLLLPLLPRRKSSNNTTV